MSTSTNNLINTKIRAFSAGLIGVLFVLAPLAALAAAPAENPLAFTDIDALLLLFRVSRIITLLFLIVFVNLMIYGGVKHMTSSGNDDTVDKGRTHVTYGFIGSVTMFMLFMVATTMVVKLSV